MTDEQKAVESVEAAATQQDSTSGASTEVDYQALLDATLAAQERAEQERDNYKKGMLVAKGKQVDDTNSQVDPVEIDRLIEAAVAKKLNSFQSEMASTTIENLIASYSTDPAKQQLIKLNWQNKVLKEGSLSEQVENAVAITDRQAILKTNKELAVALTNRSQLANASVGTHTESQPVKDNYFTKEQLDSFKAKGWDDKKIQLLKANLNKNK